LVSLALDSVSKLEIATQRASRHSNIKLGAALGVVPGAALGFGFGTVLNGLCESGDCGGDARVPMTILGGAVGLVVGAVVGALFPGRMDWQQVTVPR